MLSDCISDGNQCESNKCSHGDCVDMLRAYACRCHSGYEGKYCEYRESVCLWLPRSISNVILKKDYKSEARSVQYNETASSNKPHL